MRKKEEILEENKNALPSSTKALVEVLIDIRDLLIEHKPYVQRFGVGNVYTDKDNRTMFGVGTGQFLAKEGTVIVNDEKYFNGEKVDKATQAK